MRERKQRLAKYFALAQNFTQVHQRALSDPLFSTFMNLRFSTLPLRSFLMLFLAVAASGFSLFSMPVSAQAQRGGGSQAEFRNDSSRAVKLMLWDRARSSWDSHGTLNPGTTSYKSAETGDHWAFVDPRTNQVISSLSVGRFARQLTITNESFGDRRGGHNDDHGRGGGGHGGRPQPAVLLEIHASNRSSQTLYLYRDGGSGALEWVETLSPGQERRLKTPPNTLWAMVSPKGNKVVSQTRITTVHNDLEVYDSDLGIGRPTPRPEPSPRPVSVTFANRSAERLVIYHKERNGDGHQVASIQPRQQERLSVAVGDQYLVLRSSDRQVVHSVRVPSYNTTVSISQQQVRDIGGGGGGGDRGHGGGRGHGNHDDHADDRGRGGDGNGRTIIIDPREIIRNIFRR